MKLTSRTKKTRIMLPVPDLPSRTLTKIPFNKLGVQLKMNNIGQIRKLSVKLLIFSYLTVETCV